MPGNTQYISSDYFKHVSRDITTLVNIQVSCWFWPSFGSVVPVLNMTVAFLMISSSGQPADTVTSNCAAIISFLSVPFVDHP